MDRLHQQSQSKYLCQLCFLPICKKSCLEKIRIYRIWISWYRNDWFLLSKEAAILRCLIMGQSMLVDIIQRLRVLKFSGNLSDHNIWRRKSQTWPNRHCGTFIFSIGYQMFANRATKEIQQPHTANRPNLAALQLSRAEP